MLVQHWTSVYGGFYGSDCRKLWSLQLRVPHPPPPGVSVQKVIVDAKEFIEWLMSLVQVVQVFQAPVVEVPAEIPQLQLVEKAL